MWTVILTVLTVLISSYLLYGKYLESQKDIHELALQQQSSISSSRKPEETAVYRNNLTPHGMPLITGLQIRQGFKLRNGNLRDVWSVVMNQKKKSNRITFGDDSYDVDNLNAIFKRLNQFFILNDSFTIGITFPFNTFHGFIVSFTCFFNGLTLHHFNQLPRSQPNVDLIIVLEDQLKHIRRLKYKIIIVISEDSSKRFEDGIFNWSELGDLPSLKDDVFDYKYIPKYDEGLPLIQTNNFISTSYTHQNFVSAIASIVKTIPLGHELNESDVLSIKTDSINNWPKILAVLLFGGSIKFDSNEVIDSFTTILLTDSTKFDKLLQFQSNWLHTIKLQRAQQLFSEGIFSESASLPLYKRLRLIYINNTETPLNSENLSKIRVLTGSRIITERFFNGALGSVLSTNFYDYRVFSNNKLINRGTSSLSLEIKLSQYKDLDIEKEIGELCIRGFIIGKPLDEDVLTRAITQGERVGGEGWMPTGIIGKFGNDGCFYEI